MEGDWASRRESTTGASMRSAIVASKILGLLIKESADSGGPESLFSYYSALNFTITTNANRQHHVENKTPTLAVAV